METPKTQAEVARYLDMSENNLREVLKRLGINWPAPYDEITVAYLRDLREKAAQRGGDKQQELTIARIRETSASADLKELLAQEKAATLIVTAEIEPMVQELIDTVKQEFLHFPEQIAGEMKNLYGIDIDVSLVQEKIDQVLSHFSTDFCKQYTSDVVEDG